MTDLNLTLPLRIRRLEESFAITDAAGHSVSYVYFRTDRESQASTRRVGPEDAERIAKVIARAVTAEIGGKG